ncbi:MAG: hypothetical protein ABR499_07875 [Gemmatimonadaceae bacterium]
MTHSSATGPVERELSSRRSTVTQWFGLLAGPLAMLGNLQAQYALVPWACYNGVRFAVHIPPVVFLAVVGAAAILARREWRAGGAGEPDAASGVLARARFLGALGVATSAFFGLVIVAMWLADAFLNTCDGS